MDLHEIRQQEVLLKFVTTVQILLKSDKTTDILHEALLATCFPACTSSATHYISVNGENVLSRNSVKKNKTHITCPVQSPCKLTLFQIIKQKVCNAYISRPVYSQINNGLLNT
jgi:hypothetical protein